MYYSKKNTEIPCKNKKRGKVDRGEGDEVILMR